MYFVISKIQFWYEGDEYHIFNDGDELSVCHHGGYPPKPCFAKLSNLELHYFHGGTAWESAIKVENVLTNTHKETYCSWDKMITICKNKYEEFFFSL